MACPVSYESKLQRTVTVMFQFSGCYLKLSSDTGSFCTARRASARSPSFKSGRDPPVLVRGPILQMQACSCFATRVWSPSLPSLGSCNEQLQHWHSFTYEFRGSSFQCSLHVAASSLSRSLGSITCTHKLGLDAFGLAGVEVGLYAQYGAHRLDAMQQPISLPVCTRSSESRSAEIGAARRVRISSRLPAMPPSQTASYTHKVRFRSACDPTELPYRAEVHTQIY